MSNITALMVDGDRDDPYTNTSRRSDGPDRPRRTGVRRRARRRRHDRAGHGARGRRAARRGVVADRRRSSSTRRSSSPTTPSPRCSPASSRSRPAPATPSPRINAGVLAGPRRRTASTPPASRSSTARGSRDDNAVPPSYLTRLFVKINAREAQPRRTSSTGCRSSGERGSLAYDDRFCGRQLGRRRRGHREDRMDRHRIHAVAASSAPPTAPTSRSRSTPSATSPTRRRPAIDTLTTGFYRCGDNLSNQ